MQKFNNLEELFVHSLQDLYNAESQILEVLPKLQQVSQYDELKNAFGEHHEQTKQHKARLEQIFKETNTRPEQVRCRGMQGILEEGQEYLQIEGDPWVKDAALIAAAQRVEHYEISGYGTVRTWAEELGRNSWAKLLQQTLDEESQTNEKLTRIAMRTINLKARR